MTSVEVRIDALERGDVPAISVKTGKPCANAVGVRLRHVRGVVPMELGRARVRRAFSLVVWPLLVVAIIGVLVWWPLVLIALGTYGLLVLIGDYLWIGAKAGSSRETIVLTRVHPAFADAVNH